MRSTDHIKAAHDPQLDGSLYQYDVTRRFDPGAPGNAFEPLFNLPKIVFRGRARIAGQFGTMQPPQIYFNGQLGVTGLGGIQAGQVISQPLLDPSEFEGA